MTPPDPSRAELLQQALRLKRAAAGARAPELPRRPAAEPARLGELQRGLWLLHRLDPSSPAYNLASAFRLHGPLDRSRLEAALNQVVARHRILRSTFRAEGDEVLQVVHPPAPSPVEVVGVERGGAPAAAVAEARRPFDLSTGPLLRLRLIEESYGAEESGAEESDRERWLLLVLHHILADERSLAQLWQELATAYEAEPASPELTEPEPAQYDDFSHWQRHRQRAGLEAELDFWRRRLDPPPEDLGLPFESPAPAAVARGRLLRRRVDLALARAVRELAAGARVTPFTLFAFAFRLLLQRATGERRNAFATPASVRSHPATARMIGYFLNPVVVAGAVDEAQPVGEALRRFGEEMRQALAHAELSFQRLVEELAPPRRQDRHPFFQAMFVYQELPAPPRLGSARLERLALDLGTSKFDLTLFAGEDEEGLEIAVEYRADRYDEVWMQGLLDHYRTLLEHLPEDPLRATAAVPMLAPAELEALRGAGRGAVLDEPAGDLLPLRILDQARRSPRAPALVFGGETWTYAELEGAARAIARGLADLGAGTGDRVGLFLERGPWMIAALLGSHWTGAAYVPLDPAYPAARNGTVLDDAEVAAVITTSTARAQMPPTRAVLEVDGLAVGALEVAAPEPTAPENRAGDAIVETLASLSPEAPAYLLYTSGSTGGPKGVVVSHANLRASTAARRQVYGAPGRFLLLPSVAFDSSVAGIFWTLAGGGALIIPSDEEARDPRRLAQLVARQGVTGVLCVPSLYTQMLENGGNALGGLEIAIVAGESCPPTLVEAHFRQLPGVRLYNEYGPTEATVWATVEELADPARSGGQHPVAIGRPIPGVRVELLDALGRPVPAGVPGQAWIEGPTVAQGYWRRPELTAECFDLARRRYRSGDRMAWTADGRLLFLGRADEQIKLRGFRIEPAEVEAALLALPAVRHAAVVARSLASGAAPGPAWGGASAPGPAQLVAFVESTDPDAFAGWRRELAQRLPEHMIPTRLVALAELPRLANGKIDRRRLREMPLDATAPATGPGSAPTDAIPDDREQVLLSLWHGLLGRPEAGLDDNFFELGGHSLLVAEMILAIERDFEVALTSADVFAHPTVRGLARLLRLRLEEAGADAARAPAPVYRHLFPLQPSGSGSPFIVAVPHFFSALFAARFRGERPVYGLRGVSLRAEGNLGRWPTMESLGEDLVQEIERRFPGRACILAGYSFGASMAVEAARLLEERGLPARRLYLIAPMPLDLYRLGPLRLQIDDLRRPVGELSAGEALGRWLRANHPLARRGWARLRRRLLVQPWRRVLSRVGRLRRWLGLPLTPRILHADVRAERFRLHAGYRPGTLRTPTFVFNPQETGTDAAATWRPHFTGPFTVYPTPDPHLGDDAAEAARRVILEHLQDLGDGREPGQP